MFVYFFFVHGKHLVFAKLFIFLRNTSATMVISPPPPPWVIFGMVPIFDMVFFVCGLFVGFIRSSPFTVFHSTTTRLTWLVFIIYIVLQAYRSFFESPSQYVIKAKVFVWLMIIATTFFFFFLPVWYTVYTVQCTAGMQCGDDGAVRSVSRNFWIDVSVRQTLIERLFVAICICYTT